MVKMNVEVVKNYLAKGGKAALGLAQEIYGKSIDEAGDRAFADAIEIGIKNTIASLYDASVDDNEIVNLLNKFWGISRDEAIERLLYEKQQSIVRELRIYLKLQNMSESEIRHFWITNKVASKIENNPELRDLRKKPAKLLSSIKGAE